MKRRIWFLSMGLFILAVLITCLACLAWLAGTTEGTRTIISGLSGFTGIRLEVEKVTGNLSREVLLEGVSMRLKDAQVHIGSARLKCELFHLLTGKLAVQELSIRNVTIRDKRPDVERPFDLAWPKVPFLLGRFDGWINRLDLSDVSYQRLDEEPVHFTHLAARALWYQGVLHASSIDGSSGFGRIEGSLSAGLVRPSLDAALSLTPADQTGFSRVSISTQLTPALHPGEVSGSISMTIKPASRAEIRAASRLTLARQTIELSKIEVSQKGRRGTIDAEGSIDFSTPLPRANLTARIHDLDLSPELNAKALVSGTVSLSGDNRSYGGSFSLDSKGESWRSINLSGDIEGDLSQARLRLRKGSVLGASITGEMHAERSKGISIEGNIQARNFNPATLLPTWDGEINLDARGNLLIVDGRLEGTVAAAFPGSKLRGHPLAGRLEVQLRKGVVSIPNFDVHTKGFDLSARGALNERITYDARIGDLSALIQGGKGRISANGWVRFAKGTISGTLQGAGSQVAFRETSISEFNVSLQAEQGTEGQLEARANIRKAKHGPISIDSAALELKGSAQDHMVTCDVRWPEGKVAAMARGSYREGVWQATLTKLDGKDRISPWRLAENSSLLISAQRVAVSRIMLAGTTGEHLELSGDMSFSPRKGFVTAAWNGINLTRLQGILGKAAVSGGTTGALRAELPDKGNPALSGTITATGRLSYRSLDVTVTKASADLNWGREGLQATWQLNSADGTRVNGRASSTEPLHASVPGRAKIEMAWDGLDMATLNAWLRAPSKPTPVAGHSQASTKRTVAGQAAPLPAGFDVQGRLSGNMSGELLPGRQVNVRGETSLAQGVVAWRSAEGLIKTTVEQAKAGWTWQGESVTGNVALALSGYGHLEASFQLPITARIPPVIERDGPVRISVTGEVRERGLLTAFFPGLIQESSGQLTLDVRGNGTWSKPALNGQIRLAQAGAYLPSAGIQLKNVEAEAEFVEDQIRVTSFTAHSGQGRLHGKATIRLKDWQIDRYEGSLQGESFQTVYLPELQMLTDPELTFEGTARKVVVRGTVRVPDFLLHHPETQNPVRPSSDVVIVGAPTRPAPAAPLNLDAEVNIILGDHVRVQAIGIDAQLGGTLLLSATSIDNVTAKGEIRVIKGQYASAGVKLDITRGRIIFSGGPPEKAALDIVATRKIQQVITPGKLGTREEIFVGVNVGGTISSPAVKLYADPAMADPEILSYIVFGRPLSPGTEQSALLSQVAGTLLAAGPSSGIQQRLKSGLGLDTVDIVDIAPSSTAGSSVARSLVTVGKYLSPQLYVSLGHSLFTGESLVTARYRLSKHWEVESKSGMQVGADLFYRIEFE